MSYDRSLWPRLRRVTTLRAAFVPTSGVVALVLAGTMAPRTGAQQPAPAAPSLVFDGVTIVDLEKGKLVPGQRVVIAGNRIHTVGRESAVPVLKGVRVVDARGKYLIPGLWDMHVHVKPSRLDVYSRLVANGVTGVREIAQRFEGGSDLFRKWQGEIMAGIRVGPRSVGPSVDLSEGNEVSIKTPEDARRVIDSLKAAGIVFLKYHKNSGNADLFFAMAREARRVGLPLVGHVSVRVTNVQAADSGMRSIEHLYSNHQCWRRSTPLPDSAALEKQCAPVVQAYIRNGTWVVPTLAIFHHENVVDLPFEGTLTILRTMRRLGLTNFLAGTDADGSDRVRNEPGAYVGFSLLEEIVSFTRGGLTPLEALRTATLNPALFFNATDSLGTIEPGKLADLVLLDADPLADIRSVMRIRAVVANGRYFDRATLDTLDPKGVALAQAFLQQPQSSGGAGGVRP